MSEFMRFTALCDGTPVFLRPDTITGVFLSNAEHAFGFTAGVAGGLETIVSTTNGTFRVKESVDDVMCLLDGT